MPGAPGPPARRPAPSTFAAAHRALVRRAAELDAVGLVREFVALCTAPGPPLDAAELEHAAAELVSALQRARHSVRAAGACAATHIRSAYAHRDHRMLAVAFELVIQLAKGDQDIYAELVDVRRGCYVPHLVYRMAHHIRAGHFASRTGIIAPEPRAPALPVPGRTASPPPEHDAVHTLPIVLCEQSVRLLTDLCCHVCLSRRDLRALDATFVEHLLAQIEATWALEAQNTALTLLVAALNEQYMAAHTPNLVVGVLARGMHKTFGENLVFMLNRSSSAVPDGMCVHLLVLKVLDQLFGSAATAQCLYTNDLRVLVDVILRELHDLPLESEVLHQVYLQVFLALVTHTQLQSIPYKCEEARRLFVALTESGRLTYVSQRTRDMAQMCLDSEWCGGAGSGTGALPLAMLHSAAAAACLGTAPIEDAAWPAADDAADALDTDMAALDLGFFARRRAPPPPTSLPTTPKIATPELVPTPPSEEAGAFRRSEFATSMPELMREPEPTPAPAPPADEARSMRARFLGIFTRRTDGQRATATPQPPAPSPRRRAPPPPPR